jgi:RNA polymerase sigma factor (sigma-70 family)
VRRVDTASVQTQALPLTKPWPAAEQAAFEVFYREQYRRLVKFAVYLGASMHDAEDAVADTMADAFRRWSEISDPAAWARQAVKNHVVKGKTRGLTRLRDRLREQGECREEGREDARLTVWEDQQWVTQLLSSLPPAQREVMALIVDELTPIEIAAVLGRDPATIRQRLHAARQRLISEVRQERRAAASTLATPAPRRERP